MRLSLATKFSVTILGVVVLAILSSLVTLNAALRVSARLEEADLASLPSVRAEEVKIDLLEGNNLLAAYLLDKGNPVLEEEFRALQPHFQEWITTVHSTILNLSNDEKTLLLQLKETWTDLDARRAEVITLSKKGETDRAREILLKEVDGRLSKEVYGLCRRLIDLHENSARESMDHARSRMRLTTWEVGISSVLTLLLGGFLLWLFFYRVLLPLRGMVADAQLYRGDRHADDEGSEEDESGSWAITFAT